MGGVNCGDVPRAAEPVGGVRSSIQRLNEAVSRLDDGLTGFYGSLDPLLLAHHEGPSQVEGKDTPSQCSVTADLRAACDRLEVMSDQLVGIRERLDL